MEKYKLNKDKLIDKKNSVNIIIKYDIYIAIKIGICLLNTYNYTFGGYVA